MPTPFTHFTQSALSLRNFTQLYTALRISTHFTHFTQSSKTLGTLRTLRNLRELTYFTQLYSALRKAKILYATLRGGETLYASFTRRLRKVHLLYAHFTHTLRNFTQFNALYARPDYFTQLYAHGNLLMLGPIRHQGQQEAGRLCDWGGRRRRRDGRTRGRRRGGGRRDPSRRPW